MVSKQDKAAAIEKVRKLMEFNSENGASENEIENAMKLAQRLMLKFSIEEGDIGMTELDVEVTEIQSTWKDGMEAKSFEGHLLNILGRVNNCRVIISGTTSKYYYRIVGFQQDREATFMMYNSILTQVRNLVKTRYKESNKSVTLFKFTTSYQMGFMMGLKQKLEEDKVEFLKFENKDAYGLIVVKKDDLIAGYIKAEIGRLKSSKSKPIGINNGAYEKGKEDGSQRNGTNQLH